MVAFVGSLSVVMVHDNVLGWPGGPAWFLAGTVGVLQALNALHSLYLPAPSALIDGTRPPSAP